MSCCPKCGKEVPSDAMFCPYCGSSLESMDETFHKSVQEVEKAVEGYFELIDLIDKKGRSAFWGVLGIWLLFIGIILSDLGGALVFLGIVFVIGGIVVIIVGIGDYFSWRDRQTKQTKKLLKQIKDIVPYFMRK